MDTPAYETLLYEHRGRVTLITIDRPERMNAIDGRTHRELVDAWNPGGSAPYIRRAAAAFSVNRCGAGTPPSKTR